jgi:NADH-quinone oxidoreductase subunit L
MGGLSKKMPITFVTFLTGYLAIIGFPLLSGFFSKEAVLGALYEHNVPLFWVLSFTAFLTAFYMSRLFILAFFGDPRDAHKFAHAHESPLSMALPLGVLAVLSVLAGGLLHYNGNWELLIPAEGAEEAGGHFVMMVSLGAFLSGSVLALAVYRFNLIDADAVAKRFPGVRNFLARRYADEFYLWIIEHVYHPFSRRAAAIDYDVIDQSVVDGAGWLGRKLSAIQAWLDDKVVDGVLVNGFGYLSQSAGAAVRRLQSGLAQFYLLMVAFGLSLLVLWAAKALG